jgi:hypothetical protein
MHADKLTSTSDPRGSTGDIIGLVSIRKAIWLIIISICVLVSSCQDIATTWSAEARSPDGQWLATASSEQIGGPGTAYDGTSVYLKRIKGFGSRTQVLGFSHQYATMTLKMEWLSPTHLEVTYGPSARPGDRVNLGFEVVKYGGVDISVRELSDEKTNAPQ